MLSPSHDEIALEGLIGRVVPSEVVPGVSYRIVWRLGEGAMSVVFYALRVTADGELPVVIKVLRPSFVQREGETAALIVKKESIALGRLNERVPPTPFVVRFIDTSTLPLGYKGREVIVPWLVVEYVHGGAEGTTLSERVENSLRSTGSAFNAARAAHAIECLASGLLAVHEVGVIHRDLKPDNVLCCGFGGDEMFKIADFGVARPAGIATFNRAIVGTPGFVAPEISAGDPRAIGSWSDIFSLAGVIFYVLTGEEYFVVRNAAESIVQALNPKRRSILDTRGLSPELRAREQACRSIDFALACASSAKSEVRPHRADSLAAMLVPWLHIEPSPTSLVARPRRQIREQADATQIQQWSWSVLRNPTRGLVIRDVAWDADGRCMATTNQGLAFWNGASWSEVPFPGLPAPGALRFVQRVGTGRWSVWDDDGTVFTISSEGVTDVQRVAPGICFERVSGDLDDLAVLVGRSPSGPPMLCGRAGKRWVRPLQLTDVSAVASIAQVEDARWLIAGRNTDGTGYAAVYSPLEWRVERLPSNDVPAYLSCAGRPDRGLGLVTGADGAVLFRQGGVVTTEIAAAGCDLTAAAIDVVGRGWAASAGRIWLRRMAGASARGAAGGRWGTIWSDSSSTQPIVALFADLGVVMAMTAEGGLIEGRLRLPALLDDTDAD